MLLCMKNGQSKNKTKIEYGKDGNFVREAYFTWRESKAWQKHSVMSSFVAGWNAALAALIEKWTKTPRNIRSKKIK